MSLCHRVQAHTGATAAGYGHLKALAGQKKKTVQMHDLRDKILLKDIYIFSPSDKETV